jgi:hypothetical protein
MAEAAIGSSLAMKAAWAAVLTLFAFAMATIGSENLVIFTHFLHEGAEAAHEAAKRGSSWAAPAARPQSLADYSQHAALRGGEEERAQWPAAQARRQLEQPPRAAAGWLALKDVGDDTIAQEAGAYYE